MAGDAGAAVRAERLEERVSFRRDVAGGVEDAAASRAVGVDAVGRQRASVAGRPPEVAGAGLVVRGLRDRERERGGQQRSERRRAPTRSRAYGSQVVEVWAPTVLRGVAV
jgi:hypothetical protein